MVEYTLLDGKTENGWIGENISLDSSGNEYENVRFVWSSKTSGTGFIVYNESSDNNPNIRVWNGIIWGEPIENYDVGAASNGYSASNRSSTDEILICTKDYERDINCLRSNEQPLWYTVSGGEIEDSTDSGVQNSFDLGYEKYSGEKAVAVYSGENNLSIPKYSVYDATSLGFELEQSLSSITTNLETVRAIQSPVNDDILFILGASDQDIWTAVWDGDNNQFYSSTGYSQTEHGIYGSYDEDFWFDFSWDMDY